MSTKKYNHIHKFKRDRYSTGRAFYYCTLDCTFKIDVKHSIGKTSLCNKCGTPFEMNEYSIRAAKPKCMNCVDRRKVEPSISAVNLDEIIGVTINADTLDRHNSSTQSEIEVSSQGSIDSLQKRMQNILVKEYNPEDEEDAL